MNTASEVRSKEAGLKYARKGELLPAETQDNDARAFVKAITKWGYGIGVLLVLVVMGIASLMLPLVAALTIDICLAVIFISIGVVFIAQAIQTRTHGSVLFEIAWGAIYLFGGMSLLLAPRSGIVSLALILGIFFIAEGIGKVLFGVQRLTSQQKFLWISDGAIAILLGVVMLVFWPGDSVWVIGLLVGLRLLFAGSATIAFTTMFRKSMQTPEIWKRVIVMSKVESTDQELTSDESSGEKITKEQWTYLFLHLVQPAIAFLIVSAIVAYGAYEGDWLNYRGEYPA